VTQFGQIVNITGPGLHFKLPFPIQSVTKNNVGIQNIDVTQTRAACGQANASGDSSGNTTYTKDQQFVYSSVTAQINLPSGDGLKTIQTYYQSYPVILQSYLSQAMKEVLGTYNTIDIPSQRGKIAAEIAKAFQLQVNNPNPDKITPVMPVTIAGVQFKNFDFSCQYEEQVEKAAEAKTELTRKETELLSQKVEKDKTIVNAEGKKQQTILEGEGDAEKILAKASAEAKGVNLMQEALAKNPIIIDYVRAKTWDGHLPTNMFA
jgi:membrane protease subunit HflK